MICPAKISRCVLIAKIKLFMSNLDYKWLAFSKILSLWHILPYFHIAAFPSSNSIPTGCKADDSPTATTCALGILSVYDHTPQDTKRGQMYNKSKGIRTATTLCCTAGFFLNNYLSAEWFLWILLEQLGRWVSEATLSWTCCVNQIWLYCRYLLWSMALKLNRCLEMMWRWNHLSLLLNLRDKLLWYFWT